ncbi:MAG: hypothetical protein R3C32_00235 [Chloroflexota bacterium]
MTAIAGTILGFPSPTRSSSRACPAGFVPPSSRSRGRLELRGRAALRWRSCSRSGSWGRSPVRIRQTFGINIYQHGFSLYTQTGLELVYLYFQLPLMDLIIAPAIDGLKREWREAAENLAPRRASIGVTSRCPS